MALFYFQPDKMAQFYQGGNLGLLVLFDWQKWTISPGEHNFYGNLLPLSDRMLLYLVSPIFSRTSAAVRSKISYGLLFYMYGLIK